MVSRGRTTLLTNAPARRGLATLAVAASVMALSACSSIGDDAGGRSDASPAAAEKSAAPVDLSVNVPDGAQDVTVDTKVKVKAEGGEIDKVRVAYGEGADRTRLPGGIRGGGARWVADDLLEPGQTYHMKIKGHNVDGEAKTTRTKFTTEALSLDQQAYPSMQPLQGETVGVGMPVIVSFDIPVTNKAAVEKRLSVTSKPKVKGSWNWLSDTTVHYRPKKFWPAGTEVHVGVDVNGVQTAEGIYGQESRSVDFEIGRRVVSRMNVAKHALTVRIDGKVARRLPATSGKNGFATRNGTKLIMQKFTTKRMDAATTGISKDDPEYYNIADVRYAMRVTNSGEFIHAAPWSVGSQGSANVSHGCVGLSTEDAHWFFNLSHRGDPVRFVNSTRGLEPGNGWTDWNQSFKEYKQGSALH
ncbi:MAG: Ig-like domain-containing protein [Nocardioidaceae bacterium]